MHILGYHDIILAGDVMVDGPCRYREMADVLKAMAHPVRLCILEGLLDGECNVSAMQHCLGLRQASVSQHLSVLRSRGIVNGRREGSEVWYSISKPVVARIVGLIRESERGGADG